MGNYLNQTKKPLTPQEQSIESFVNQQLKDANINIGCLPDSMEKEIYINILKILLGNVTHIVNSVKIEFMNHVITLRIEPKQPEVVTEEHEIP